MIIRSLLLRHGMVNPPIVRDYLLTCPFRPPRSPQGILSLPRLPMATITRHPDQQQRTIHLSSFLPTFTIRQRTVRIRPRPQRHHSPRLRILPAPKTAHLRRRRPTRTTLQTARTPLQPSQTPRHHSRAPLSLPVASRPQHLPLEPGQRKIHFRNPRRRRPHPHHLPRCHGRPSAPSLQDRLRRRCKRWSDFVCRHALWPGQMRGPRCGAR